MKEITKRSLETFLGGHKNPDMKSKDEQREN